MQDQDNTKIEKGNKKSKSKTYFLFLAFPVNKDKENEASEAKRFFESIQKRFDIFYSKEIEKNNKIYFIKILKYEAEKNQKDNLMIKLTTIDNNYFIKANPDRKMFIYEISLIRIHNLYKNIDEILQNQITLSEKLEIFGQSLAQNKELLDKLYEDTIKLYSSEQKFDFLIEIFINVYENKNLCPLLLNDFKKFNDKLEPGHNDKRKKNIILNETLEKYKEAFIQISKNSDNIIIENKYDPAEFYGVIFCYLNNYDHENFQDLFKKLMNNSKKVLFEILMTYIYFFKNPIIDNEQFFIEFMEYVVEKKTYKDLTEKCMQYYKNIYLLFTAIDSNKEKIISMKDFKPIKIKDFDDYSCTNINDYLDSILTFSKNEGKLLIILSNSFWENLITIYKEPTKDNIQKCSNLANGFNIYSSLINDLFKDKKEVNDFLDRSQFEYLLDNNIQKYINNSKDIKNEEIISFIMYYDIYYKDDKYIDLRNPKIFDKIDFNTADNKFCALFHKYNFEKLFEKKIEIFLSKLVEKIEKLSHFLIILKLIDVNEQNISKRNKYLQLLNNKYENLVKKADIFDKEEKNIIIESLSELTVFFYLNENETRFLKNKINKLGKDIKFKIYFEIIKICKDKEYQKLKNDINWIFIENLKTESLDEFITFVKQLEEADYLDIMNLINEKYLIDIKCFFNNKRTININLIVQLHENGLLKFKEKNIYYINTEKVLITIDKKIKIDEILIKEYKQFLENKEEDIINRLNLLTLVNKGLEPKEKYIDLKNRLDKIKIEIDKLLNIRDSLKKFHKTVKDKQIQEINKINEIFENGKFSEYESMNIKTLLEEEELVKKVNDVKDSEIFYMLYSNDKEIEQNKKFENAYIKLINFIQNDNLEELPVLSNFNMEKVEKEVKLLMEKFNKNKNSKSKSKVINYKKHEININSIFYFFENFYNNDKEWNEFLSIKY